MKTTTLSLGLTAALSSASLWAAQSAAPVPVERCGAQADRLAVWTDASGSMMKKDENGEPTRDLRELLVKLADAALPHTDLITSVTAVAPYAHVLPEAKRSAEAFRAEIDAALPKLETFGRPSLIGKRAEALFASDLEPRTAVLFVTDGGLHTPPPAGPHNQKSSLTKALDAFAATNPTSCLLLISAARTPEEKARIAETATHPAVCRDVEDLTRLLQDESHFRAFVEKTLWRDCSKVKTISLSAVLFKFDRADLTPKGREYLKGVLPILKTHLAEHPMTVVGHTCTTGPEAYNKKLSLRRAQTVKNFLIANGCDAARIKLEGLGESNTYAERAKNRRVEVIFSEAER